MSGAIILLGTMYGVLALVLALLNRRDGRADALRGTIAASLTRELRDTVSVSIAVTMWSPWARVTLDMRECAAPQTWQVIERLGPRLPRGTTLSVIVPRPAPDCETSIRVIRSVAARTLTALGA